MPVFFWNTPRLLRELIWAILVHWIHSYGMCSSVKIAGFLDARCVDGLCILLHLVILVRLNRNQFEPESADYLSSCWKQSKSIAPFPLKEDKCCMSVNNKVPDIWVQFHCWMQCIWFDCIFLQSVFWIHKNKIWNIFHSKSSGLVSLWWCKIYSRLQYYSWWKKNQPWSFHICITSGFAACYSS